MTDGGPLVSVVLIFWNEEQHIAEAIQSVLSQSFSNWELLLVDDGSTDASADIVTELAKAEPGRVRLLRHQDGANLGMSASRNLGITNAIGEWISFIDGDDFWEPTKLEHQLELLAKFPGVDVLVSPALWWYGSERDFVQKLIGELDSINDGQDLVAGFLRDEWASLCDVVARRSIIAQVGGYQDEFDGMFEDQVFHSKLLLNRPVLVSGQWWYRYRQHDAASTSLAHRDGQHRKARIKFLAWLQDYVKADFGALSPLRIEVAARLISTRLPVVALARRFSGSIGRQLRAGLTNRHRTAL